MIARLPEVSTLHRGELDRFITELVEAGFRMVAGDEHAWVGPTDPALSRLTPATEMQFLIRDGWPYKHPYLFVSGLGARVHVSAAENVCLWDEADSGYGDWLSLKSVRDRIAAWVTDQDRGPADLPFDAHLYFRALEANHLVLIDLDDLIKRGAVLPSDGESGALRADGKWGSLRVGSSGSSEAYWFWIPKPGSPPRSFGELEAVLSRPQRSLLSHAVRRARRSRPALLVALWNEGGATNGLALRVVPSPLGQFDVKAVELARTDESTLRLRGGRDQAALSTKRVTVFGLGSIGSHVAMLLAQAGVGSLQFIDDDVLRPGNLTRHASAGRFIGLHKVEAMRRSIGELIPHVKVQTRTTTMWSGADIVQCLAEVELIIEATGNEAYRSLLSRLADELEIPMIAVALHRGGAIGRVQIQAGGTHPIWGRVAADGYSDIPAGEDAPEQIWELGCGAPINNASPIACAAVATLAATEAVRLLTGTGRDVDKVDVYVPLPNAPFDRVGVQEFPRAAS